MKTKNKIEKYELKVYVTMHDDSRLMGSFFLEPEQRLQDLMNDDRSFLPLYAIGKTSKQYIVMISKRYIEKVEELHASAEAAVEAADQRSGVDRRTNIDRRCQRVTLQIDPIASRPGRDPEDPEPDHSDDCQQ